MPLACLSQVCSSHFAKRELLRLLSNRWRCPRALLMRYIRQTYISRVSQPGRRGWGDGGHCRHNFNLNLQWKVDKFAFHIYNFICNCHFCSRAAASCLAQIATNMQIYNFNKVLKFPGGKEVEGATLVVASRVASYVQRAHQKCQPTTATASHLPQQQQQQQEKCLLYLLLFI